MTTTLNFDVNGTNREIQFVGNTSLFRIWITGQEHGGVTRLSMHGPSMGVIHAFTDMAKVHRYNIHERGLHLRPTMERLAGHVIMENVGYVNNTYKGAFTVDGLDKLKDTDPLIVNWGTVNYSNGRLFVGKRIEYRQGELGEADYITHERNAVNLLNGFEMLMTGASFDIQPITKGQTRQSTGEVVAPATIINLELQKALQVLSSTDDEARDLIAEAVAKKEIRRTFAKVNAAIEKAAETGQHFEVSMEKVGVIRDESNKNDVEYVESSVLMGASGYLVKGTFVVSGVVQLDSPSVMANIKKNNLKVIFA